MSDSDSQGKWSSISGLLRGFRFSKPPSEVPRTSIVAPGGDVSKPPGTSERPRRAWKDGDWEEDKRFLDAISLMSKGDKAQALTLLERLLRDDPEHAQGRIEAFGLSILLQNAPSARAHAEWVAQHHAALRDHGALCMAYRAARDLAPELVWSEKTLVQVALAADKTGEARLVVDATKLLMSFYPSSPALPRLIFATAKAQDAEGRSELSRATLEHLVATYPLDPLAKAAEAMLAKLPAPAEP